MASTAFAVGRDRQSFRNRDFALILFSRARASPGGLEILRNERRVARKGDCLQMMPERSKHVPKFEFVEDIGRDGQGCKRRCLRVLIALFEEIVTILCIAEKGRNFENLLRLPN